MSIAKSADELALLKELAAEPANFDKKKEYAAFLTEAGDSRGSVVQKVIEAVESDADLPSLESLQEDWLDVTGITIIKLAIESGFRKQVNAILGVARPALKLIADEPNFEEPSAAPGEVGTTRLGGDPDLLSDYPHTADGRPFVFLGQFNLADFRGLIVEDFFPELGVLSVFRTPTVHSCACFPDAEDLPKLVQYAADSSQLKRVARPEVSSDEEDYPDDDRDGFDNEGNPPSVHMPYRPDLKIVETLSLPGHSMESWLETEDDMWDFESKLERDQFLLLGHAAHANTGDDPIESNRDLVQLMRLPFMEGPDFGVTDCNFSIYVQSAELRTGKFDHVETLHG